MTFATPILTNTDVPTTITHQYDNPSSSSLSSIANKVRNRQVFNMKFSTCEVTRHTVGDYDALINSSILAQI